MLVKRLVVGPIQANCFIIGCDRTKNAAVIDPGDEGDRILLALADAGVKATHILNTHGHFDHVGANRRVKEVTGAVLCIHALDAPMLAHLSTAASSFGLACENSPPADTLLADGDIITVGSIRIEVIHTPGHTPGGVSFYIPSEKRVFCGDTLFAGSIGRTDFPGGDYATLISSIKNRLLPLGDDVVVHTGHGPDTTIQSEKRFNPFLQ